LGAFLLAAVGCSGNIANTTADGEQGGSGDGDFAQDDPMGGSGGNAALEACKGDPSVATGLWRRLTASQYTNTVKDLLGQTPDTMGLVLDSRTGAFKTNARSVQEGDVDAYDTMAQKLAASAVGNLNGLLGCDTKTTGEDKCAAQFIKAFGARAYRRPLKSEEETAFNTVYTTGKEENFSAGIRLIVQAMLTSPSFLYMVETGTSSQFGLRKLSGYEVASRLSYTLIGTMPDAALFDAAGKGQLDSLDGVKQYAKKLIDSEKFIGSATEFHIQLSGVDVVTDASVGKGGKFPEFNDAMRAAMLDEPRKFVNYVMTKGGGTIEEMLSANYVFPAGPLAKVYGGQLKPDGDGRAEVADGSRRGLLTLAGVQASHPKQYSPRMAVNRGHLVRRDFLCEEVPAATGQVDFTLPPNAEKMTAQELLREHQTNPTCKGCHELMDSIGFGFESYDALGAYRTKDDGGNTINPSGEIVNLEGGTAKFENAGKLAETLSTSPQVRSCMATQWMRFSLGRDVGDEDACSQQRLAQAFTNGKGNIKEALLSLATSDSFRFNRGE